MPVHKNATSGACTAALALALAACNGGGGGGGGGPAPEDAAGAKARAEAVAAAIEAAKAVGEDGGFDDTAYGVAPSVTAVDDGTTVTIGVTESGTPRGGSARSGAFAEQEDAPAAIAGWTGVRFQRATAKESLAVYSDVGAPREMAFIPENLNKLDEVSGLTGDTVPASGLDIDETAWLPVILSTSLTAAPANSSVTYSAGTGPAPGLEFTGTFGGGSGTYRCSGDTCSVTLDDRGAPTAMVGTWAFLPDSEAIVRIPDYEHLHFGWWLSEKEDGAYGFQTFAGAGRFPAGAGNVTLKMEGTATYRGAAAGRWAKMDVSGGRVTAASSGEFTAEAVLTANFYDVGGVGVVNGEIASFKDGAGVSLDGWRATLNAARLTVDSASFAGTAGGTVGPGTSGEGSWEGRFHGTDGEHTHPTHVTGRFDLHFPGVHLAGAFGADR